MFLIVFLHVHVHYSSDVAAAVCLLPPVLHRHSGCAFAQPLDILETAVLIGT